MGYFSKENREKRGKTKEVKRLARSIAKGKCDDPRATLEKIRELDAKDGGALAQSYLTAAANSEGEVRNGLVMLFLRELYSTWDHALRRKTIRRNIDAIENIRWRGIVCDGVEDVSKKLRDGNEIQSRINDYDDNVGEAISLLLAASHSILANGNLTEADRERARERREKEAEERTRIAQKTTGELVRGEYEDPQAALEAVRNTSRWNSQMVADMLVFASSNEECQLDALALSLTGLRALPEKEGSKVYRNCEDELRSILGDDYEKGGLEEQCLAYLAEQGYDDNEFWSKAFEWNGRGASAVKALFGKGERGWDILVDNLDEVKHHLRAEQGFIFYALENSRTVGAKLTALEMLENAGYDDVDSHDVLFDIYGSGGSTDVAAKAFEMLVKREEEGREETIGALLRYESNKAEDDPSRYRELLEHLITRKNGVIREGVLTTILTTGDQQGMDMLADSFGDLGKAFAELGAEAAEKAAINALRNGKPASRNAAFDFAASVEEPSEGLLEEVATQLGNGNGKAALGVFISQGQVPSEYEDQVLAAVESDDLEGSVMATIAYTKCDTPNMKLACEKMLAKHGDGEHWKYLVTNADEGVREAVVDGLYPLKEQGGWELLIRFDHEIESEEMEKVLRWGMESENKELKATSLERVSYLNGINDPDLLIEVTAHVKDPEYRESALRMMVRSGQIPHEQMDDLIELVEGDDVESAVTATRLLAGVTEKNEEIIACLKDAATSSKYKQVRMTAIAMLPALPQVAEDDEMLGMLKDLAIEVESDELSSIARGVLASFSMPQVMVDGEEFMQTLEALSQGLEPDEAPWMEQAVLASVGEPQGKAGQIVNELLELAEKKIETADPDELAWVCRTIVELKEAGIPHAEELLMEKLIPELVETVTEDREEHEDMYAILLGKYGSLDNILNAMKDGGLVPGEGQFEDLIRCEDGTYLDEKQINNTDKSENLRGLAGAFLISRQGELGEWLSRDENEHIAEEVKETLGITEGNDSDEVMVDLGQVQIDDLSELLAEQFELDDE